MITVAFSLVLKIKNGGTIARNYVGGVKNYIFDVLGFANLLESLQHKEGSERISLR